MGIYNELKRISKLKRYAFSFIRMVRRETDSERVGLMVKDSIDVRDTLPTGLIWQIIIMT